MSSEFYDFLASKGIFLNREELNDSSDDNLSNIIKYDISVCVKPSLPRDIHRFHNVRLEGYHILQIQSFCNIAESHESRAANPVPKGDKRMLKLFLSDGEQVVPAIEYIKLIELDSTRVGAKVLLHNSPFILRGVILLQPNVLKFLGGGIENDTKNEINKKEEIINKKEEIINKKEEIINKNEIVNKKIDILTSQEQTTIPNTTDEEELLLCEELDNTDWDAIDDNILNEPPPRVYEPPPRVNEPPPRVYEPPPRVNEPPPRVYEPPHRVNEPPPRVYEPPPRVNEPPPRVYEPPPRVDETPHRVYKPPPRVNEPPPPTRINETSTSVHESFNPSFGHSVKDIPSSCVSDNESVIDLLDDDEEMDWIIAGLDNDDIEYQETYTDVKQTTHTLDNYFWRRVWIIECARENDKIIFKLYNPVKYKSFTQAWANWNTVLNRILCNFESTDDWLNQELQLRNCQGYFCFNQNSCIFEIIDYSVTSPPGYTPNVTDNIDGICDEECGILEILDDTPMGGDASPMGFEPPGDLPSPSWYIPVLPDETEDKSDIRKECLNPPGFIKNSTPVKSPPGYIQDSTPAMSPPGFIQDSTPIKNPRGYVNNSTPVMSRPGFIQNSTPIVSPPGFIQNSTPIVSPPGFIENGTPIMSPPGFIENSTPIMGPPGYIENSTPIMSPPEFIENNTPIMSPPGFIENIPPIMSPLGYIDVDEIESVKNSFDYGVDENLRLVDEILDDVIYDNIDDSIELLSTPENKNIINIETPGVTPWVTPGMTPGVVDILHKPIKIPMGKTKQQSIFASLNVANNLTPGVKPLLKPFNEEQKSEIKNNSKKKKSGTTPRGESTTPRGVTKTDGQKSKFQVPWG
eukprot:GHVL01013338.1.p1 GENE.GHVL01013338.1~~GHVL01013338.1.p1  ORF type:complete len:858 (+),score=242.84 GHVL01013338.1:1487-4060(+)